MADKNALSDQQIVELTPQVEDAFSSLAEDARSGDTAACRDMIDTCRKYLLFIANQELDADLLGKCGASDVVQNTMVQAVANFGGFRGQNKQALLAWLRQILLNEVRAVRRRYLMAGKRDVRREIERGGVPKSTEPHPAFIDPELTPATEAQTREDAQRLRVALATLRGDHQRVLRLRNWERLSFAEIGKQMQRSEDAAKKLWARALGNLRDALNDDTWRSGN